MSPEAPQPPRRPESPPLRPATAARDQELLSVSEALEHVVKLLVLGVAISMAVAAVLTYLQTRH